MMNRLQSFPSRYKDQDLFQSPAWVTLSRIFVQRRFLFLLLGCSAILLLVHHAMQVYSVAWMDMTDAHSRFGLILDTPGCRVPKLDPYDKSVKDLIRHRGPYVCDGLPVFLIGRSNATLELNETLLNNFYKVSAAKVACTYQAIQREPQPRDYPREDFISYGKKKRLRFGVPLGEEFLKVECMVGRTRYTQYVGLVPIKPDVERTRNARNINARSMLNVVLIGIDSVSKLNFLRQFKKTHGFLTSTLSAFDMKGYTKVADNTFPNLTPMLTGHFVEHYFNDSVRDTYFFDELDFIWKEYAARGYRTLYAEDAVYTGVFNFNKRGFRDPPTDYYFRPLGLAMANFKQQEGDATDVICLNDQLETEIFYRYLKNFLETMRDRPSFSFTMVSSLTHDRLNYAGYVDEPTYRILKDLYDMGTMDNSLVVVFSDHGLRFGTIRETYVGKIEERMPFMYLALPAWFLEENPQVAENLKTNQNRLVTLFDLHATLQHFLKLSEPGSDGPKNNAVASLGTSMMSEVPEHRTCETANILPHWCPCQVYQYQSPDHDMSKLVASAIVDEINRELESEKKKCALLETDQIVDARVAHANDLVQRYVRQETGEKGYYIVYGAKKNLVSDYLVTLRASPGGGVFEGTVRYNQKDSSLEVLGISRINKYGSQSSCIDSPAFKKFCFCK